MLLLVTFLISGCIKNDEKVDYGFNLTDASENSTFLGKNDTFENGEPLVQLVQTSSNEIDWNEIRIYGNGDGSFDGQFDLVLLSINDDELERKSNKGDKIVLTVDSKNNGLISSNDYIWIKITIDEKVIFDSNTLDKDLKVI